MMRSAALVALGALLSACSDKTPAVADQGGSPVECALDGAREFAPVCYLHSPDDPARMATVIQHPDGGFRVFDDGESYSGLIARDGAEESMETVEGGKVVLTVGNDRYRFAMPVVGG